MYSIIYIDLHDVRPFTVVCETLDGAKDAVAREVGRELTWLEGDGKWGSYLDTCCYIITKCEVR